MHVIDSCLPPQGLLPRVLVPWQNNFTLVRTCSGPRAQNEKLQTPIDAWDTASTTKTYPLPIAFPSVTAWIARATVATLPAFSPAMEMRPSFVR